MSDSRIVRWKREQIELAKKLGEPLYAIAIREKPGEEIEASGVADAATAEVIRTALGKVMGSALARAEADRLAAERKAWVALSRTARIIIDLEPWIGPPGARDSDFWAALGGMRQALAELDSMGALVAAEAADIRASGRVEVHLPPVTLPGTMDVPRIVGRIDPVRCPRCKGPVEQDGDQGYCAECDLLWTRDETRVVVDGVDVTSDLVGPVVVQAPTEETAAWPLPPAPSDVDTGPCAPVGWTERPRPCHRCGGEAAPGRTLCPLCETALDGAPADKPWSGPTAADKARMAEGPFEHTVRTARNQTIEITRNGQPVPPEWTESTVGPGVGYRLSDGAPVEVPAVKVVSREFTLPPCSFGPACANELPVWKCPACGTGTHATESFRCLCGALVTPADKVPDDGGTSQPLDATCGECALEDR